MEEHYRAHLRGRGGGERRGEEHPGVGGTPRGEKERSGERVRGSRAEPAQALPRAIPRGRGREGGRREGFF